MGFAIRNLTLIIHWFEKIFITPFNYFVKYAEMKEHKEIHPTVPECVTAQYIRHLSHTYTLPKTASRSLNPRMVIT